MTTDATPPPSGAAGGHRRAARLGIGAREVAGSLSRRDPRRRALPAGLDGRHVVQVARPRSPDNISVCPAAVHAAATTPTAGPAWASAFGRFFLNSIVIAGLDRRRQRGVLPARRVRVRPAAVPAARVLVRHHDRHPAAARPRADHPAVHPVPARSTGSARLLPLIVPQFLATEAFFVFLMVQFMRGIPRELDEAARIDGCGAVPGLPAHHPAAEQAGPGHHGDLLVHLDLERLLPPAGLPQRRWSDYTVPVALRLFIDSTGQTAVGADVRDVGAVAAAGLPVLPRLPALLVEGINTSGLKG